MPRRNVKIKADQAYWIKKENGKGYSVYSYEQLQRMIDDGKIKDSDLVQIRVSKGI